MKVLSLLEPWASLIAQKKKYIETRSWKTNYRGVLYIHTSKKKVNYKDNHVNLLLDLLDNKDFKYGAIIAKCTLKDCICMDEKLIEKVSKNKQEFICGGYSPGRYAWILDDIELLEEPIYTNGHLSIWEYKEK